MPRVAERPEDLLSQSEALSLSGLEFMQRIVDGTNPGPPIGQTIRNRIAEGLPDH